MINGELEEARKNIEELTDFFKMLDDPSRVQILTVLFQGEMAVTEIADQLGMSLPAVSYQLRILKANGLVRKRREGKNVLYKIVDEHVRIILEKGKEHIEEKEHTAWHEMPARSSQKKGVRENDKRNTV